MSKDKKHNSGTYSPSTLIGKRFGGFRDDMVKMSSGQNDPSEHETQSASTSHAGSADIDYAEYKKIIDTRTVEEIEAENEALEKIIAPDQELKPEKELESLGEMELETLDEKVELEAPAEKLAIEPPEVQAQIMEPEVKLEIETPAAQRELESPTTPAEQTVPSVASTQSDQSEPPTAGSAVIKTSRLPANAKVHDYRVTIMPPQGKFRFKRIEWYWHIVKRPAVGLALFLVIIYSLRTFSADLPGAAWSILDVLGYLLGIYIFFIIAWRVTRSRHESRSQAMVAGFCAGVTLGLILSFFRMIYIFKVWTLINLIVEPIISGLVAGLITGAISLFFKKKPYNT